MLFFNKNEDNYTVENENIDIEVRNYDENQSYTRVNKVLNRLIEYISNFINISNTPLPFVVRRGGLRTHI